MNKVKFIIYLFFSFIQVTYAMEWNGDSDGDEPPVYREPGYISPPLSPRSPRGEFNPSPEWCLRNLYELRLRNWHGVRDAFQGEIEKALRAKEDFLSLTKASIDGLKRDYPLPEHFVSELNELLETLKAPEEMFTQEERRVLLDCQTCIHYKQDLKPIHDVIKDLRSFIEQYNGFIDFLIILEQVFDHIPKCNEDWEDLSRTIQSEIEARHISKESALRAFDVVRYCHNYAHTLNKALQGLQLNLKKPRSYIKETLSELEQTTHFMSTYLKGIAESLWGILAPIVPRGEEVDRPLNYQEIPPGYFQKKSHPLKTFLLGQSEQTEFHVEESSFQTPIKQTRTSHFVEESVGASSPPRMNTSLSAATSPSPRALFTPKRKSLGELGRQVARAFVLAEDWDTKKREFKERFSTLANAKFVLEDLEMFVTFYKDFLNEFVQNQSRANDLLYPRARIGRPGKTVFLASQALTRNACSLVTNGLYCWDIANYNLDRGGPLGSVFTIGDLRFSTSGYHDQTMMGVDSLQSALLALFDLPRDPIDVLLCNVFLYANPSYHNNGQIGLTESILKNPTDWPLTPKTIRVAALPKPPKHTLDSFLEDVRLGKKPLALLNKHSQGMWILYHILTQGMAESETIGIEKRQGSYYLKRIYSSPFFHPLFGNTLDKRVQFLGKNAFYLLPLFGKSITAEVKREFLSHDPLLMLKLLVSELEEMEAQNTAFCATNKLDAPFDEDEFDRSNHPITTAQAYGYTTTTRKEMVEVLISNFRQMAELLAHDSVTYQDVLQNVRPYEYACYKKIQKEAEAKVQDMVQFFHSVLPLTLKRLEKVLTTDPHHARYSHAELKSFKDSASLFFTRIQTVLDSIEILKEKLFVAQNQIQNKEGQIQKLADKVSELQELLPQLEGSASARHRQIEEHEQIVASLIKHSEERTDTSQEPPLLPKTEENEIASKKENVRKEIEEVESQIERLRYEIGELRVQIDEHQKSLETEKSTLTRDKLLIDFAEEKSMSPTVIAFFQKCLETTKAQGAFKAARTLKAIEILSESDKPQIYDTIPGNPTEPVPTLSSVSPWHHFFEATHPVESMKADITRCAGERSQEDPAPLLEDTQFERATQYPQAGRSARVKQAAAEQIPGLLFHDLLVGKFVWDPFHGSFFHGICDLLMLPRYHKEAKGPEDVFDCHESIGLMSSPWGKGGIFYKEPRGGEHYLCTFSEYWALLFQDERPLCSEARNLITGHALPLFLLAWTQHLEKNAKGITFHPWFIEKLLEKSQQLQAFVSTNEHIVFQDILRHVYPEIYFVFEHKFSKGKSAQTVLQSFRGENERLVEREPEARGLSAVEQKGTSLRWKAAESKPNMRDLLAVWDRIHEDDRAPLDLSDVVAAILNSCLPQDHSLRYITRLLESAHKQPVRFERIAMGSWQDPELLRKLIAHRSSINIIEFLGSLRVGTKITLTQIFSEQGLLLTISGLNATEERDTRLLLELLTLFSDEITCLNLGHNHIWSLDTLIKTLQRFKQLRELHLNDNPFSDPQPLVLLPTLITLNLSNTGVPLGELANDSDTPPKIAHLRSLLRTTLSHSIGVETPLPNLMHYENSYTGEAQNHLQDITGLSADQLLGNLKGWFIENNHGNPNLPISILERLGENHWQDLLGMTDHPNVNWMRANAGTLLAKLKEEHQKPRASACRVLFAVTHGLPKGTVPEALIFGEGFNNKPGDVRQLTICDMEQTPNLSCLTNFVNLTHLSLYRIGLIDLGGLPKLTYLKFLNISHNSIATLDGLLELQFPKFPKLCELDASYNQLTNGKGGGIVTPLSAIKSFKLQKLILKGNHLTKDPIYSDIPYLDISENDIEKVSENEAKGKRVRIRKPQREKE